MLYIIIQIIVILGLIAFPIIKSFLNGVITVGFIQGFLLGIIYELSYFGGVNKEDEEVVYRVHVVQFNLFFVSISMGFSIQAHDMEIEE